MKKLIPAIALLLVSVVLLSTSSFAWFSMNTQVTATGMSVTADAPTSLLISNTSATTGFGSTVALANDNASVAAQFSPVAYAGVCASFYKLTAAAMAKVNENGRVIVADFTEIADGSDADDFTGAEIATDVDAYAAGTDSYYHDRVWLKVEGQETKNVTATVAYTNSPSMNIKNAMHVVFVVGGSVVATVDMGAESLTTGTLANLVANAAATQVDIYYFLSGNDTDCKNSNISADATLSIDITFNAVNP